jgi:hypothetical protein
LRRSRWKYSDGSRTARPIGICTWICRRAWSATASEPQPTQQHSPGSLSMRRKGELSPAAIDRESPHQVVLPSRLGQHDGYNEIHDFVETRRSAPEVTRSSTTSSGRRSPIAAASCQKPSGLRRWNLRATLRASFTSMPKQDDLVEAHQRRARIIADLHQQAIATAHEQSEQLKDIGPQIAEALRRYKTKRCLFVTGIIFWALAILFVSYLIARGL